MKSYTDFVVDISTLRNNIINIKNNLSDGTKFCAVVKANAYGHGIESVCKNITDIVDFFAVACLKEALSIRVFDKTTKIIILSRVEKEDIKFCFENNISISISSLKQLKDYDVSDIPIKIHLQVNTGLNRFGFRSLNEFKKTLNYIEKSKLILEGVYSHFATKDNDKLFIKKQDFKFNQFRRQVKNTNVIFHIANSFATLYNHKYHYGMIRNGFLMYGYQSNDIGNKPVLSMTSRIINILRVRKGDTIGYDRTYIVPRSTTIAVVPVGYADGFNRALSNNFSVLISGKRCRVIGLICMDVFMVDVGSLNVSIGDKVTLLGSDGGEEITLEDYAIALNTSPYAVLLGFNYRRMNYLVKM